jgi:hypothetical protein
MEDHTDLDRTALDETGAALGNLALLANAHFGHLVSL